MLRMNLLPSLFLLHARWPQRLGLLTLLAGLSGCANVQTGAGVNIGVPILPGVSLGVNVGTGGISAGVNAHSGPVGVGVGVNGAGQVTGRAGVGVGSSGPVSVGGGVGVGGVIVDPQKQTPPESRP
jgi:hypothetical protein